MFIINLLNTFMKVQIFQKTTRSNMIEIWLRNVAEKDFSSHKTICKIFE